jgi:Omp85 superfamily domain
LRHGPELAVVPGMTKSIARFALLVLLLAPGVALARVPQAETNVNSRYPVESVSIAGVSESKVSRVLADDMQKLVGNKYDPDAVDELARRLRKELHGHTVTVRVKRGEQSEHVKVVFDVERVRERSFEASPPLFLYTTKDSFSGALVPDFETHHNYFSLGLVSSADELLERNSGVLLRYEHRKVGTDLLQVGLEYDYFHPSFQPETEAALALAPEVPGIYRIREVFSPSISLLPIPDIKVTFGASLQTLQMQYPALHDQASNAYTFTVQFRREEGSRHGLRHSISADYSLRDATSSLESDFRYTRQFVAADYTLSTGRQSFEFHFQGGHTSGQPPLYERFSIGNATTLRGWDKFDVAPIGGTRLVYGSVEYRYRPLQLFYDFGTVWDPGQPVELKHSVGFGFRWRNGFFISLGVPLRFHSVTPVFMFGLRL